MDLRCDYLILGIVVLVGLQRSLTTPRRRVQDGQFGECVRCYRTSAREIWTLREHELHKPRQGCGLSL